MIGRLCALVAIVALLGATTKPASKTTPVPKTAVTAMGAPLGVWTVHMTEVDAVFKTGDFSTPDHVLMTRNGGDINADRASGNFKKKIVTLYGHVVVHDVQGAFDSSAGTGAKGKGPSTLTCDQLRVDSKAKNYVATGHVHYVQGDTSADADNGTLDDAAHTMDLAGHVAILDGPQTLRDADRVHYDTVTGQMHAESDKPGAVILEFPGGNGPVIATPRPVKFHNPLNKKKSPPST